MTLVTFSFYNFNVIIKFIKNLNLSSDYSFDSNLYFFSMRRPSNSNSKMKILQKYINRAEFLNQLPPNGSQTSL